jgi:hypothetical protein
MRPGQRLRKRLRPGTWPSPAELPGPEAAPSQAGPASSRLLLGEEHAEVLAVLRRLPHRQREAVILRFYGGRHVPLPSLGTTAVLEPWMIAFSPSTVSVQLRLAAFP